MANEDPTESNPDPSESAAAIWEDPPEWMERLQEEEDAELIATGTNSRSIRKAYLSLRKGGGIGLSQRAMYEYFSNHDGIALAIKDPSGGGAKKLFLKPIDDPDEFQLASKITRKESGSGSISIGNALEDYNLVPDEAEQYEIKWDDDLDVGVVNLNQSPLFD